MERRSERALQRPPWRGRSPDTSRRALLKVPAEMPIATAAAMTHTLSLPPTRNVARKEPCVLL